MAEETLQFLKREEVRTMAKDIAKLREQEATEERTRIAKIKTEEPKLQPQPQPVQGLKTHSGSERPAPPSLMPHAKEQKPVFVKAKTRPEKIIVRVIVIGVLLFILANGLAFGYWYFTRKNVVKVTPGSQTPGVNDAELQQTPGVSNALTPVLFFDAVQEKTIEVATADNLLVLLSGVLKEEYPQGFTRILLKEGGDTTLFTMQEFLNKAGVAMPEPLLSLLEPDFMLFMYTVPGKKRLGFMGELSQTEGVQDMLQTWETTLEQDMKALWETVGQKGSAYAPFFRPAVHQNNLVRFQTFSVLDFGVVYALFGTKLILTTSFESATKAIDLLIQNR